MLKRARVKGSPMDLEMIMRDWSEAVVRFLPNLLLIALILFFVNPFKA